MISGILAGLAGLVLVGYVGIVDNWTGRGYELDSIAAAVIGGAALSGGKGSVPGVLLATLVLVSLFNIVVILGLSIELQLVIKGSLIVLAAAVYMSLAALPISIWPQAMSNGRPSSAVDLVRPVIACLVAV